MDAVIEIHSSPDSTRKPSNKRPRPKPKFHRHFPTVARHDNDLVIELTDSDEDDKGASRVRKKARVANIPTTEAGPSRLGHERKQTPPQFGQPRAQPKAGSSSAENITTPNRNLKSRSTPLFLPSDEENEPPPPRHVDEPLPPQEAATPPFQRQPTPNVDPLSGYVARVLEIIPDVQPDHLLALITKHLPTYADKVVEPVLHILFEDPTYPKVDKKGKRKHTEEDEGGEDRGNAKVKVDYGSKDREYKGGLHYTDLALEQLMVDFPYIPKPHIRRTLFAQHTLYAPTHFFLAEEKKQNKLPYAPKTTPYRPTTKGKGKAKALYDAEFEKERNWLLLKLQENVVKDDAAVVEGLNEQEYEDNGDGIECGCCFADYPFDKMIQCPEAHLFCTSCMTTYAETLLGAHDPNLICMDQSGCKLSFPPSELHRFLSPKLLALYERVKQTKEIEAAGLEGLEECPFCDYKCVIENPQEKLFRCGNENGGCGAISCRECKKLDHVPKSCKEMEEDKHLDGRHAIEEAMTRALMRNCPKCQKAFIKELGCNKMTCPNCHTMSCYICRKVIDGYDHFAQQSGSASSSKCVLWDPVEQRHADEVNKAAEKALEDYKRDHPDIDEKDIKVDLATAPPPAANPLVPPAYHPRPMQAQAPVARAHPAQFANARAPAIRLQFEAPAAVQVRAQYPQHVHGDPFYNGNVNAGGRPLGIAPGVVAPPPAPPVHAHRAPGRRARR